jgi:hypothetical protein
MPSNPSAENVAKSVVLAAGVALLLAVAGFVRLTLAETRSSAIGELEDKIAGVGIVTFDEVCISNAYDQARFNSSMDKVAQRKLTLDEYQHFVPGGARLSELFYDIPILGGNAHIFVGRVSYKNGSHNCMVVMKISERIAMRHWLNLHLTKYSRSPLQRDKRAPFYFVGQGPKKDILVQITHEQTGERRDHMSYYSFFK